MLCLCKIFLLEETKGNKILTKSIYISALRDILKPLAKNLISREITLPVLVALIKESLVDAAEKDRQEIKKTDSRISLITGVHRKDVRKIRELGYKTINDKTLNARVLAEWTGNRNYTDPNGSPKKLRPSGPNSFEQMVSSISTDIRPRTLLDEWITLKKVTLDDEGSISLDLINYAPSESDDELLHFFGKNIGDHISSATNNIEKNKKKMFERASYGDQFSEESIKTLESLAEKYAMNALLKINKKAFELSKKDSKKVGNKYRFRFGSYFYNEKITVQNLNLPSSRKKSDQ